MNDSTARDTLRLEVANFGPIVKGEVDLRPLTVFVGPSNTGKSYMAILIYALHRYFSNNDGRRRHTHLFDQLLEDEEKILSKTAMDALIAWMEQEFPKSETLDSLFDTRERGTDKTPFILPDSVTRLIQSVFDTQGDPLSLEIRRCFGSDIDQLIRKGSRSDSRIVLRRELSNDSVRFELGLTSKHRAQDLRSTIPGSLEVEIPNREIYHLHHLHHQFDRLRLRPDETERKLIFLMLLESLADLALPHLVGPLHRPAFYLPADRTGVMHAHSVVVSALIGNATRAGLRPAPRTPMLSGVLADFLEQLIELDDPRHRRGKTPEDHGTPIEEAILCGSVLMEKSDINGYPRFTYRPDGWKDSLPLMNASSMVSELAPVVLYLRHVVMPGNVLIVEEPESHLHPAMQVEFSRQLAALVRSDIRVIVTTHSEWVLEELANIVQRPRLPEKQGKQVSVSDVALRPDQVGVWLFKPTSDRKGSEVKEIRLDESGLYPSGFDEVAAALHNDWAEISSRTGEAE